jgi:hypothetical protein
MIKLFLIHIHVFLNDSSKILIDKMMLTRINNDFRKKRRQTSSKLFNRHLIAEKKTSA